MARRGKRGEVWTVDRVRHPVLPLLVALDPLDRVVAVSLAALPSNIVGHARRHRARLEVERRRTEAHRQLLAYLHGELREFDLRVRYLGTPFQIAVWKGLRKIPYGHTHSYGELADDIGKPRAVRAVGAANGRNPIPVIVPCHRVIGQDGKLTGFGGGLPLKRWLLELEGPQVGLGNWVPPRRRPTEQLSLLS